MHLSHSRASLGSPKHGLQTTRTTIATPEPLDALPGLDRAQVSQQDCKRARQHPRAREDGHTRKQGAWKRSVDAENHTARVYAGGAKDVRLAPQRMPLSTNQRRVSPLDLGKPRVASQHQGHFPAHQYSNGVQASHPCHQCLEPAHNHGCRSCSCLLILRNCQDQQLLSCNTSNGAFAVLAGRRMLQHRKWNQPTNSVSAMHSDRVCWSQF
mmetsp:Transcript_81520/g.264104  ORF Transcript_81520/g.264104 Transcript_81520/m.264104 type:complete len:211 (-) Transcript_81520:157-789(-)